ncbi:DUF2460 domain-containing protein [Dyella kyungheensis]|uniref:DUF2460 domain-containing protein n=1 Tax=Dyella kyungheensis TaxID=1242174 RepID=UPI003CFADADE
MSNGFINKRLSLSVESGFVGGPEWSTDIQSTSGGREKRNQLWKFPKHHYTASLTVFTPANILELRSLFYACAGQWGAFRFRDVMDFTSVKETLAVAVGTQTPVQLIKTYAFGDQSFSRQIQAPVDGSVTILDADGLTPIAGTLDVMTGLFTPTANWPHSAAAWTGQFDVWVRFASDYGALTAVTLNAMTSDIELLEVLV